MRIILVRHGETEENKKKVLQGQMPGTLSKEGIKQAELLAERLRDEPIDAIYTSDLARARDTARIISKYHKVPFIEAEELRERDFRSYHGAERKLIDWNNLPPEVEKDKGMFERAEKLLRKIIRNYKDKAVLIVGHSGINRAVISVIKGKDHTYMNEIEIYGNTSVTVFDIGEDSYLERITNCTGHLSEFTGIISIVYKGDKYLLIRNPSGNITFPAGGREKNESQVECLERELEEEIGLNPSQYKIHQTPFIHKFEYLNKSGRKKAILPVFLIETSSEPKSGDCEVLGWFNKKEVLERLTFPDSKELFKKINLG